MNWFRFSLFLGTLFIIAYLIFTYVYKPWTLTAELLEQGPVPLNEAHSYTFLPAIAPNDSFTVSFYIYPVAGNRTGVEAGAAEAMYSIFNWAGLFSLQLLPQVRSNNSSTRLLVKTVGGEETLDLPPIILQKWTYISFRIEGRRIDVLYNGRVVGSKIFDNMLKNPKAGMITSGNINMVGRLAYVSAANRKMSADEIMIDYVSSSNTRGEPYLSGLGSIKDLFSCPAGSFCLRPGSPPNRASSAWYTPFN